jgi:uncharacterized protein YcfJ
MRASNQRPHRAAALAAATLFAASAAYAQSYAGPQQSVFQEHARVVSATPIVERVAAPSQQCQIETYSSNEVVTTRPSAPVGAIVGGIAGGLIGHQFGSGSGNTAATIGGAVAGAAVGNHVDQRNRGAAVVTQGPTRQVERCYDTTTSQEVVRGYRVVYRYDGREFTTEMPYDPGPRLRVDIAVSPAQ